MTTDTAAYIADNDVRAILADYVVEAPEWMIVALDIDSDLVSASLRAYAEAIVEEHTDDGHWRHGIESEQLVEAAEDEVVSELRDAGWGATVTIYEGSDTEDGLAYRIRWAGGAEESGSIDGARELDDIISRAGSLASYSLDLGTYTAEQARELLA